MTITIEATYEKGVLKPKEPLILAEGAEVRITISAATNDDPFEAVIGTCDGPPDGAANHDKSLAERTAGMMGWKGTKEQAEYFAMSHDLDFPGPEEDI